MKKFWSVFMFAALVMAGFTLASCGNDDDDNTTTEVRPTVAEQYQGTYSGIDNLNVSMSMGPRSLSWDYATANAVSYTITANADNTINVLVPTESYSNTQIGDITIGSNDQVAYQIDSLKYDEATRSFTRTYKGINEKVPFTSTGGTFDNPAGEKVPVPPISGEFSFLNDNCVITVSKDSDGKLVVKNVYGLGNCPMLITNSFSGTRK